MKPQQKPFNKEIFFACLKIKTEKLCEKKKKYIKKSFKNNKKVY